VTYIASGCADNDETFLHETVYKAAGGEYACPPITDLQGRTAVLQSRKAITIDGQRQYITECTPDTSSRAIAVTTDGCTDMSKWTHDIGAAVSYGRERFYLQDGGSRSYLTTCQNSQATYAHSHEITGYQHHDDQLFAFPLTTVKVTAEGNTYSIVNSAVLDGAPQVPYVLNGTAKMQTGESIYEGCQGWYKTALNELWKRPDDTTYTKPVGEGTPNGPRNVCRQDTVATRNFDRYAICDRFTFTNCNQEGTCGPAWNDTYWVGVYGAGHFQNVNFETNDVVTDWYAWTTSQGSRANPAGGSFSTAYWSYYNVEVCPFTVDRLPTVPTNW